MDRDGSRVFGMHLYVAMLSSSYWGIPKSSPDRCDTLSLQQVLGQPGGLLPVGCAQKTSKGIWRRESDARTTSAGSSPSSLRLLSDLLTLSHPTYETILGCLYPWSHYFWSLPKAHNHRWGLECRSTRKLRTVEGSSSSFETCRYTGNPNRSANCSQGLGRGRAVQNSHERSKTKRQRRTGDKTVEHTD